MSKSQKALEDEKQDLHGRKEDYQKDLERLRDAQRKLERDKDAVRRQLDKMEEHRLSEVGTHTHTHTHTHTPALTHRGPHPRLTSHLPPVLFSDDQMH